MGDKSEKEQETIWSAINEISSVLYSAFIEIPYMMIFEKVEESDQVDTSKMMMEMNPELWALKTNMGYTTVEANDEE
ncbi:hypothetical protein HDV06_001631 [Boothiomyces sp. JEL0866]|nr:hypothetical protein HDV06_001631 [Boothiomyces sp. JEL0866]